jgi:hypothetical protein
MRGVLIALMTSGLLIGGWVNDAAKLTTAAATKSPGN